MLEHGWTWKYYAMWNRPDTKGKIFYNFTYSKYLEKIHRERNNRGY